MTEGERIRHNDAAPGFLHVVDEPVAPGDGYPHPHPVNASKWEWLTTRELRRAHGCELLREGSRQGPL